MSAAARPAVPVDLSTTTRLQGALAAMAVGLLGFNFPLPVGRISAGLLVALVLAPMTVLTAWRGYPATHRFFGLAAGAATLGLWLSLRPWVQHVDPGQARGQLFALLLLILGPCLLLWARTCMAAPRVAFYYGLGLMLSVFGGSTLFAENPWKYGFALPVTVMALSLAWAGGNRHLQLVVLALLGTLAALNDARSEFAMLLLTAMVLIWPGRREQRQRGRWAGSIAILTVAVAGVYSVAQRLILNGYLGQQTQLRTQEQVAAGGSLLFGSRPELGATAALMREHPAGFGVGAVPGPADILVAKAGMFGLGYTPDNGYVDHYMFGTHYELHSSLGDLWASFGVLGVVLAIWLLCLAVREVVVSLSSAAAAAIVVYLALHVCRDVLFSPLPSSLPVWVLAIALVLGRESLGGAAHAPRPELST